MMTAMQRQALEGWTHEEFKAVWTALAQAHENSDPEESGDYSEASVAEHAAVTRIMRRFDAAMASFADGAK